jgi:SPP1 family predicted phage head-tail adaptor
MPVKIVNGEPVMDPGRLRHLITFLNPVTSIANAGAEVDWVASSPPETARAEIAPFRGIDVIKAGQDISQVMIMITLRYRSDVLANRRIQAPNGSQYVIRAVQNVLERNRWMELTCMALGSND